jgi:hypothetical protein
MRAAIFKSSYSPYGGGEKYTTRLIHEYRYKKRKKKSWING